MDQFSRAKPDYFSRAPQIGGEPPKRAQREKLLARALWNLSNRPSAGTCTSSALVGRVLDYEIPLKPRGGRYDGLGKIDLLAAGAARAPTIIELKAGTKPPLEGIIEAYFYARVLREGSNRQALAAEYPELDVTAPWRLLLIAPDDALAKSTNAASALAQWCAKSIGAEFSFATLGPVKAVEGILDSVVESCRHDGRPLLPPGCVLSVEPWSRASR